MEINNHEKFMSVLGFTIFRGTKEEVAEKMKEIKDIAKKQYQDFYEETRDGFTIKTHDMEVDFSIDKYIIGEYAIFQIFY